MAAPDDVDRLIGALGLDSDFANRFERGAWHGKPKATPGGLGKDGAARMAEGRSVSLAERNYVRLLEAVADRLAWELLGDGRRLAEARAREVQLAKRFGVGSAVDAIEVFGVAEATLTAKKRDKLSDKAFALPGRRYPIHDLAHARNALSRVAQHGSPEEKKKVRAAVHKRYPELKKAQEAVVDAPLASWYDVSGVAAQDDCAVGGVSLSAPGRDDTLSESAETATLSVTHAPIGKGGKNWITRSKPGNSGQLPAYIQNVRNALMRKRGVDEGTAHQMAIGVVRNWASGKGKVHPEVRAAAAKAVAEFEKMRGKSHAKSAAKDAKEAAWLTPGEAGRIAVRMIERGVPLEEAGRAVTDRFAIVEWGLFDPTKHPHGFHGWWSRTFGERAMNGERYKEARLKPGLGRASEPYERIAAMRATAPLALRVGSEPYHLKPHGEPGSMPELRMQGPFENVRPPAQLTAIPKLPYHHKSHGEPGSMPELRMDGPAENVRPPAQLRGIPRQFQPPPEAPLPTASPRVPDATQPRVPPYTPSWATRSAPRARRSVSPTDPGFGSGTHGLSPDDWWARTLPHTALRVPADEYWIAHNRDTPAPARLPIRTPPVLHPGQGSNWSPPTSETRPDVSKITDPQDYSLATARQLRVDGNRGLPDIASATPWQLADQVTQGGPGDRGDVPFSDAARRAALGELGRRLKADAMRSRHALNATKIKAGQLQEASMNELDNGTIAAVRDPELIQTVPLNEIAYNIARDWGPDINMNAYRFLEGMRTSRDLTQEYGMPSSLALVVRSFLTRAGDWTSPVSQVVKPELARRLALADKAEGTSTTAGV